MLTVSGTQGGDTKIVTSRDTGVDIYDSAGNKVGNVPYGKDGITGKGETVYEGKGKDGKVTYSTDPYRLQSYISFNDTTGEITMHAPEEFLNSDVYKQYFNDDVISGLSRLYQQNKDAKVELADGSQKTVKELIEAWNEDLPNIVAMQKDYSSMKNKVASLLGEEAAKKYSLKTYQIQGTSAYSGRDDDYLTIPKTILNNPNWSFFKNLDGFDHDKLVITKKDFDEGYYHLDASRDLPSDSKTSISRLKKEVADAMANFKGDDVDEFARLIAFNNFLNDKTAEGASNAPEGSFTDTLVINGAAFSETAMRNTAEWANDFVNFWTKFALAPFSAVDWLGNLIKTGESKWEWKYITDELVDTTSAIVGDDLTPNADTVAEFLQNEEARRGDIYKLTNSAAGLIYDIGGTVTYTVESVVGTIAMNRLILNGIALGISGLSIKRSIPKIVENANNLKAEMERAAILNNGVPAGTVASAAEATPESVVAAHRAGVMASNASAGTKAAVNLLTSGSSMSVWEKMKLISSLNTADIINGALQWHSVTSNIGNWLATNAEAIGDDYRAMEQRELGALGPYAAWRTVMDVKSRYTQTYETLAGIFASGNALLATSGKMMISLGKFAKYVPTAYYAANIVVGTAMAEADSLRRLMDGVDNDEERSLLWGMVAKTAIGWGIAMVAGHIVSKVFSGQYDDVIEQANAKATENIAKAVHGIRTRTDQVHELMAGKDWIDNVKNPVKKAAILYNQSLQKSQEYMAKAADEARAFGVTEREARNATIMAVNQMRANQNAIDLAQNPDLVVAAWHTNAYPAYAHASDTYTGVEQELSKKLAELGLSSNVQTTALIGGVASNGEYPQDVVNYIVRAQQRQSYLRDDYDYTAALTVFGQNIDTADVTSMYVLNSPSYIAERDIAKEVMRVFEDTHPKELSDYIKDTYVPASFQAAYQLNQIIAGSGFYLSSREEGWKQSGMFGNNNQLWFPMLRVTDAQKNFEEAAKNPVNIAKSGAIKRRFYEPEHYSPGSSKMMDFVNPMITFRMYEYQKAVEYSINNWVDVNMQNPFVKHVTKLDGSQVGAVKIYNELKPHYESSVVRAMNATYEKLDVASLVNDIVDQQKFQTKVKNAQKAVDAAKDTWDNIPNIEVKTSNADKLRVVDGLDETTIDDMLQKAKVPFEGEKVDTRKWLNSKVPGFDVLEWSLLGRDHTNGLVPGGLYEATIGNPSYAAKTRAYIINIDDLAKILGYDLDNATPTMGKYISAHINNNTGKGVLPVRLRGTGDGDGNDFFMQMRWGHNGDKKENWVDYLQQLKENGVENVPIAVVDTRGRSDLEDISSSIAKRIGYTPTDITDDIKTAFSEFGKIPFYRGQKGLGQFNMNEQSPSKAVGDAYWIAPNASYTDTYGKDKIAGYIPVEYFLSDKEKADFVQKGKYELEKARKELWPKIVEEEQKLEKQILKELEKPDAPGKELVDQQFSAGLITESEKPVVAASSLISSGTSSQKNKALKYRALYRIKNAIELTDEDKKVLAKMKNGEEILRYMRLDALLEGVSLYKEYDPKDIQDYRVLAELTGKPVIDISNDGFADGTAFFYYKGISPEFDEDVGGQLAIQEAGTLRWPDGLADEMAQEWFDETTLGGFLNMLEERFPDVSDKIERVLDGLKDGKAAGDPVRDESDLVLEIAEDIKDDAPGLYQTAHVLGNRIWTHAVDGYDLDTSLTDMGMSPDRYYNEHDVAKLLEEVGYENPDIVTQEESSAWDAISPSSPNYPTYTEQDLADIRLRDLERKRKILKKILKERCK